MKHQVYVLPRQIKGARWGKRERNLEEGDNRWRVVGWYALGLDVVLDVLDVRDVRDVRDVLKEG